MDDVTLLDSPDLSHAVAHRSATTGSSVTARSAGVWLEAAPVAAAIATFGVIYGAVAEPVIGPWLAIASSLLIFSGAGQFTMIALIAAGETHWGVLAGVAPLALRHLPLGAMVRPRLSGSAWRRTLISWFLIDETAGMAMAHPERTESTLWRAGSLCYVASALGTAAGVFGASLPGVESLAAAVFPVLFIGLAALTATNASAVWSALAAAGATALLLSVWDGAGVLGAIVVAVVVAASPPVRTRPLASDDARHVAHGVEGSDEVTPC